MSAGFLVIGTLMTLSECWGSMRTISPEARPITSISEHTTNDRSGAGRAYWTLPRSNIGKVPSPCSGACGANLDAFISPLKDYTPVPKPPSLHGYHRV